MKKITRFSIIAVLVWNAALAQKESLENRYVAPADPLVSAKLARWQDLKFGLFMHWGTYSQWGIVESWTLCPEDQSFNKRTGPYAADWYAYKNAYEKLSTTFNPHHFNPERWAALAKAAGMRYMVFTTKHHDGFSMFDTRQNDYKITAATTPFSKNPRSNVTRETFDAFRKQGFMIGAYFSKADWHSPDFWWPYFPPKDRNVNYDIQKYPERWQRFRDFTYNQVQELMTGYGAVDVLWFDGSWLRPQIQHQDLDMLRIANMARKHQPGIIVVDRKGPAELENYLTPEQEVPDHYMPVPWETCMTLGDSWSYKPNDNYKSSRRIIQTLVDVVAKNGNFLLNIGPDQEGDWDPVAISRLKEIGQWMRINQEAIYNTKPQAPYRREHWAFTTNKGIIYAFYLPDEQEKISNSSLTLPDGIFNRGDRVALLGAGQKVACREEAGHAVLYMPENAPVNQPVYVFKITKTGVR